jgi:hypothetical protein
MKILSIRQPWAYLITQGSKNIENRRWPTSGKPAFVAPAVNHPLQLSLPDWSTLFCVDPVAAERHGVSFSPSMQTPIGQPGTRNIESSVPLIQVELIDTRIGFPS